MAARLPDNAPDPRKPASSRLPPSIHACCILLGEWGVLIRGPSGTGKSTLARVLIERAAARGLFARLVADDRVHLEVRGGRVVGRPAPAIAGRIECHGIGIRQMPHENAALIRCVVDLVERPDRLPEPQERRTLIAGMQVPRLVVSRDGDAAGLVLDAIADLSAPAAAP
jgi:HPr kinase/phosphorylase